MTMAGSDEENYFKYCKIMLHIVTLALRAFLLHGFQLRAGENYYEATIRPGVKNNRYYPAEIQKLKKNDTDKFDISVLCRLINDLCFLYEKVKNRCRNILNCSDDKSKEEYGSPLTVNKTKLMLLGLLGCINLTDLEKEMKQVEDNCKDIAKKYKGKYYEQNKEIIELIASEILLLFLYGGCEREALKAEIGDDQLTKLESGDLKDPHLLINLIDRLCKVPTEILKQKIKLLQNERNKISHGTFQFLMIEFSDLKKMQELKESLTSFIDEMIEAFKITKEQQEELKKLIEECNDVINNPLTITGIESYYIQACVKKLKESLKITKATIQHPISWIGDFKNSDVVPIYTDLKIVQCRGRTEGASIGLSALFETFTDTVRSCVILGPAGAGKSTLLQYITSKWVNDDTSINKLDEYDLLLFIECRDRETTTLLEYFRLIFPQGNYDKYIDAIKEKKILILVDGLDEINDQSKKLLKEIVKEFKLKHFIISSRPEGKEELILLRPTIRYYNEFKLDGIDEKDKSVFIDRYWDKITGNVKGKTKIKLLKRITSLPREISEILSLPMNLLLYICLYKNVEDDGQLNIDLPCDLYEALQNVKINKLTERIKKHSSDLTDTITDKLIKFLERLQEMAYNGLIKEKLSISPSQYNTLKELLEECRLDNPSTILCCFLSYKEKVVYSLYPIYTFPHKGLQEFLAAKHIEREIASEKYDVIQINKNKQRRANLNNFYMMLLGLVTRRGSYNFQMNDTFREIIRCCVGLRGRKWNVTDLSETMYCARYDVELVNYLITNIKDKWIVNIAMSMDVKACAALLNTKHPSLITLNNFIKKFAIGEEVEKLLKKISRLKIPTEFEGSLPDHLIQQLPRTMRDLNLSLKLKSNFNSLSNKVNKLEKLQNLTLMMPYNMQISAALRGKVNKLIIQHDTAKHGELKETNLTSIISNFFIPNKKYDYERVADIGSSSLTWTDYFLLMIALQHKKILIHLEISSPEVKQDSLVSSWDRDEPFKVRTNLFKGSLCDDLIQLLPTTMVKLHLKLNNENNFDVLVKKINAQENLEFLEIILPYNMPITAALRDRVNKLIIQHETAKHGELKVTNLTSCISHFFISKKKYNLLNVEFIAIIYSSSLNQGDFIELMTSLQEKQVFIKIRISSPEVSHTLLVSSWDKDDPFKKCQFRQKEVLIKNK